ncbi:MAG: class I SAM-dependent methyltransferase [Candidatus Bathyarchaeota archaeon]|nr:MAG: class I SAM-dependent methyltransferase [Candidatus Bathyarchaeota archaeon]
MSDPECIGCIHNQASGHCKISIRDKRENFFFWDIGYIGGGFSLAPFVATPCRVVRQMLSLAEVKPGEIVFDLGSGDGRIVILAASEFGAHAVGFELEDELVQKSLQKIRIANLEDQVTIVQDNMLNADLHRPDIITMYLSPTGNRELKSKLDCELKEGARIVSLEFEIPNWTPNKIAKVLDDGLTYTLYLYHH